MPREALDPPKDLPEEASRQVAFGQLQDGVPGMSDEAAAGLEEPLLEARQGPVLDGEGEGEPAQEIAEVGGDHPQEQSRLIGPEAVAGKASPVGGGFALLDPSLFRPTLVVKADDGRVRPGQGGDDEAHPGKELAPVMLDLDEDPSRSVPGGGLIGEAAVADPRGMAGPAAGRDEQVLDGPLQHGVGRETDGVCHAPPLQRLVEGRELKGRVGAEDDALPPGPLPIKTGRRTSSHPSALWTLPGRSLAARQSPSWLKMKRGW